MHIEWAIDVLMQLFAVERRAVQMGETATKKESSQLRSGIENAADLWLLAN